MHMYMYVCTMSAHNLYNLLTKRCNLLGPLAFGLIRCSAKETTFAIRRALTQNSYLLDFLQRHGILILEYLAVGPQDLLHSGPPWF